MFLSLLAQGTSPTTAAGSAESHIGEEISSTFAFKELGPFVSSLWGAALVLGTIAAFLFFVIGAVLWITAGGDKGKTEQAKERITQSIIGLTILALTWVVSLLVQQFLGLNILSGGSGGGGGGGGGNISAFCRANPSRCCDGWADPGTTHCRNQNCGFYYCNNGTWQGPNGTEPKCMQKPSAGCYGVNSGFDPNATYP